MIQELSPNIRERVKEKKESYRRYNFERLQEEAFATFLTWLRNTPAWKVSMRFVWRFPRSFFPGKPPLCD